MPNEASMSSEPNELQKHVSRYLRSPARRPGDTRKTTKKPVKLFSQTVKDVAFQQPVEPEPVKPITELMKDGKAISEDVEPLNSAEALIREACRTGKSLAQVCKEAAASIDESKIVRKPFSELLATAMTLDEYSRQVEPEDLD